MENRYKGLIVSDMDGTFRRWSLFLEILYAAVDAGLFPQTVKMQIEEQRQIWKRRKGSFENFIQKAIELFDVRIKGVLARDYEVIARQVVNKTAEDVYRYTRWFLTQKQRQGWAICLITASSDIATKMFCDYWNFPYFFGSHFYADDHGIFNGHIDVNEKNRKIDGVKELLQQDELKEVEPQNIITLGDTSGDFAMMNYVHQLGGKVICFNPSSDLERKALEMKTWVTVVERKDSIRVERDRQILAKFTIDCQEDEEVVNWIISPRLDPWYV